MPAIWNDLRYALRQLRRSPGFTLTAALTLALGIGAATAIFSLVDTVLLRPLAFPHPEQLVALDTLSRGDAAGGEATLPSDTSYPNFFDWRTRAQSFDALASYQGTSFTVGATPGHGSARRVDGMTVSSDFFRVLGFAPELGRSFLRAEEGAGNRAVIISHSLWQSAFNLNPHVLGQTIAINEETYTIIGVMPAAFNFPDAPDAELWFTPATLAEGKNPSARQRGWNQASVIGRLRSGVTLEQARAEMQTIQHALAAQYPDEDKKLTAVSVISEMENVTGDLERPLHLLFAAVFLLLLIACANVAGLLLARGAARQAELALRAALGASRTQIALQLLLESLTLASLGGLLGLAIAAALLRVAPALLPAGLPRVHELSLNPRVFFFALAGSLVTGLVFGVAPAWRSSQLDPSMAMRENSRGSTGPRSSNRLRSALVVGETALGLVLLVGAGLLIRSFDRVLSVDPGFNPQHLLTFKVGMPEKRFDERRRLQFSQQLQAQFAAMPGVSYATYGFPLPLSQNDMSLSFSIDGQPSAPGEEPSARTAVVASNFFRVLQMPLRRGRLFGDAEERPDNPRVMIINQAFADRFFPGVDAIGKRVTSDLSASDKPESREIIGIIQNVTHTSLTDQPAPAYYIPFAQVPSIQPTFALRVTGSPANYVAGVRSVVAQDDASLPVYRVHLSLLTQSTAQQRFQTLLLSGFAAIALLLAAVGLYAVLSYMVAQRSTELGVRLALGADRTSVLALILWQGLRLSALGLALGVAASVALARAMASLLFHTRPLDPLTFVASTLLLLAVCACACLAPAWRASRLNPNDVLRRQ